MMRFAARRWLGIALTIGLSAAVVAGYYKFAPVLPRLQYLSGWALLALMLALTFYNPRKKVPFLPLASTETWLQFHIYAGFFAVALFLAHVGFQVPRGWFDVVFAALYALVTLSGVVGLIFSRVLPRRMTTRGGEVLWERIPVIRRELAEQAEALALKSVPDAQTTTIADFYARELRDFFHGPQNLWLHFLEVRRPLNTLLNRIANHDRFLNEQERATMAQIAALVRQKDGLDYQHATQLALKAWLFVHIPLTYSLLIFSIVHIVIVFAFSGGAR